MIEMTSRRPMIIARRTLTSQATGQSAAIAIARPRRLPNGDYVCEFRIERAGDSRDGGANGTDAVQAMQQAMLAIGASFPLAEGWMWLSPGDIGFPRPGDQKFPPALLRQIDRATSRYLSGGDEAKNAKSTAGGSRAKSRAGRRAPK